jgi:glycerol uptake facilitator-like aquaporin
VDALAYVASQIAGGALGTVLAHLMFGLAPISLSTHARAGWGQGLSEVVATFGLLATIISTSRHRPQATPLAVAAFIAGAYWFTASTSFANPAVAIARSLTNTFAGIRPADVPLFITAEILGAFSAVTLFSWLMPDGRVAEPVSAEHNDAAPAALKAE